ncbi:MAG: hypothetical protein JW891_01900 [Candidatus Lokiarchaeota archaeon]|nr:hypothetical protein [Candidatus Lokiarchaeota archaeon]
MIKDLKSDFSYAKMEKQMAPRSLLSLSVVSVLMNLFFIQAMRAYIPGVYVAIFHVVFGENIVPNMLVLLTLLFFFVPGLTVVICKKIQKQKLMMASIYVVAIVRLLVAFNLPSLWHVICCGLIISFYGFYLSTFLSLWFKEEGGHRVEPAHKFVVLLTTFTVAFLADYLIRTIGFSEDVSLVAPGLIADWQVTQYFWLIFQIPLSASCIYLAFKYFPRFNRPEIKEAETSETQTPLKSYYLLIFTGMGVFLFLQFSLFLYPNAIAQYTSTNYYLNNILSIIAVMIVACAVVFFKFGFLKNIVLQGVLNAFLILSLILFLFFGKITSVLASILFTFSLVVIYLDFYLLLVLTTRIRFKWVDVKSISNAITLAFLFYILFLVLHVFTTDWAYTIEALQGKGPLILLLGGILLSACSLGSIFIMNKEKSGGIER